MREHGILQQALVIPHARHKAQGIYVGVVGCIPKDVVMRCEEERLSAEPNGVNGAIAREENLGKLVIRVGDALKRSDFGFIPLRGSLTNFLWRFYMVSYTRH